MPLKLLFGVPLELADFDDLQGSGTFCAQTLRPPRDVTMFLTTAGSMALSQRAAMLSGVAVGS